MSTNIHIIRLDPYDPNLGLLVPLVSKRIRSFAEEYMRELDPQMVQRSVMVPLWNQDPLSVVLALLTPEGSLVGHVCAAIQSDGMNNWLTVSQTQADQPVGDALKKCVEYLEAWVETDINPKLPAVAKVKTMVMVTGRNDRGWERLLGFKTERRVMTRPFGLATNQPETPPTGENAA